MPVIIHQHRLNSAAIHIAHRLQNSDHPFLSFPSLLIMQSTETTFPAASTVHTLRSSAPGALSGLQRAHVLLYNLPRFLVKQTATGKYALFFFFRKPCHTHITVIRQLQRQISIKQLVAGLLDPSVLLQQLFHDPVCLHRLFRPLGGKRNSVCISSPCIDHLRNGSDLFRCRKIRKWMTASSKQVYPAGNRISSNRLRR